MTTKFNHNTDCVGDQFVEKSVVGEGYMYVCAACKAQTLTDDITEGKEPAADNASIMDMAFCNDLTLGPAPRM